MLYPTTCLTHASELQSPTHIKHISSFLKENKEVATLPLTDIGNVAMCVEYWKALKELDRKPILGCQINLCNTFSEVQEDNPTLPERAILYAKNLDGWKEILKILLYCNDPAKIQGCIRISPEELTQFDLGGVCVVMPCGMDEFLEAGKDFSIADGNQPKSACNILEIWSNNYLFEDHANRLNALLTKGKLPKISNGMLNLKQSEKNHKLWYDSVEDFDITYAEEIPNFSDDDVALLREECFRGLSRIGKSGDQQYIDQLETELKVFCPKGFSGYFLIMSDIINQVRLRGYPVAAGRGCLSKDVKIFTDRGIKNICDIKINDRVVSKDGQFHTVTKLWEYDCSEDLVKYKSDYGNSHGVTLTSDHKVWIRKRILTDTWKNTTYFRKKKVKKYEDAPSNPEWIQSQEIQVGDYVFTAKLKRNVRSILKVAAGKLDIDFDVEFCYMLGVFTGDGWLESNCPNTVAFGFHSENKKHIIDFVESWAKKYNLKWTKIKQKNKQCVVVKIKNKNLRNYIQSIFYNYNYDSKTKHTPDDIFDQPDFKIKAYIDGFLDTDGNKRKYAGSREFTTSSKQLFNDIKYLTLLLGHPCSTRNRSCLDKRSGKTSLRYDGSIPKWDFVKNKSCFKVEGGYWSIIRSKEIISNVKKVYDIEVEEEHNYLTLSGIVHNSAAGCLISYLTGITTVDPIEYGLMFERFYSADRNDTPDIDIDLPPSIRDEIVEYIGNKYGNEKLGQLSTFGTIKGAGGLKVCLGQNGMGFGQQNEITDLLPEEQKVAPELKEQNDEFGTKSLVLYALRKYPNHFTNWVSFNKKTNKISGKWAKAFQLAIDLDHTIVSFGKHASAFVLGNNAISNQAPMRWDFSSKRMVVGVNMGSSSDLGLVKLDLLGLDLLDKAKCLQDGLSNGSFYLTEI